MPITLTGYESHDGMSEMVAVEVSDGFTRLVHQELAVLDAQS